MFSTTVVSAIFSGELQAAANPRTAKDRNLTMFFISFV
jgi:hypothetical protein